jgi:hypothetical protein
MIYGIPTTKAIEKMAMRIIGFLSMDIGETRGEMSVISQPFAG